MKITCPTCGRSYALPDGAIGDEGRDVRCSRCSTVWRARPERAASLAAAGAAAEDDAFGGFDMDAAGPARDGMPASDDSGADGGEGISIDEGARAAFPDPDADFDEDMSVEDAWAAAAAEEAADAEASEGDDGFDADGDSQSDTAEVNAGTTIDADPFRAGDGDDPFAHVDVETMAKPHRIRVRMRDPDDQRTRAERISEIGGPIMLALAILLVIVGIILRKPIVEGVPDMAGVYELIGLKVNLRGLEIENVSSIRDFSGETPLLIIEGDVRNISEERKVVPLVRLGLIGERGQEVYSWSIAPEATELDAGQSVHFRSRLASPPELGKRLQVRFMDRKIQKPGMEDESEDAAGARPGLNGIRGDVSSTPGNR